MKTKFIFIVALAIPLFFISAFECFPQTLAGKLELPGTIIQYADTDGSMICYLSADTVAGSVKYGVGTIDLRNPVKPVRTGFVSLPAYEEILSFARIDRTIYVTGAPLPVAGNENLSLVTAIDVKNPAKPAVIGSLAVRNKIWYMRPGPGTQNVLLCSADDLTGTSSVIFEIDASSPSAMKMRASGVDDDYFSFYQPAGNYFALSKNNSTDWEHPDVRLTLFDKNGRQLTPAPVKMPEVVGWGFNDYLASGSRLYGLIRGDGAIGYIVAIDVTNPAKPQYAGLADMYQAFPEDSIYEAVCINGYIYLFGSGYKDDKPVNLIRKIKADAFAVITPAGQAVLPALNDDSYVVTLLAGNNVMYVVTSDKGIFVFTP